MRRLGKTYNGIEKAVPYGQALHVANSIVTTATNGASAVAVETRSLMLTTLDNAKRTFDEFRNRMAKGLPQASPSGRRRSSHHFVLICVGPHFSVTTVGGSLSSRSHCPCKHATTSESRFPGRIFRER